MLFSIGVGEKLICLDQKSGDCTVQPDFNEDGVERFLQCTVIRDKNNREK